MNLPDSDPNAAILKLSQSVELVVGEGPQQFQAAVTLAADSAEVATQVASIAQGLVALNEAADRQTGIRHDCQCPGDHAGWPPRGGQAGPARQQNGGNNES